MTSAIEGARNPRTEIKAQDFFTFQRFGFREVFDENGQQLGWSKTFVRKEGGKRISEEVMFRVLSGRHVEPVGNPPLSAFDIISKTHREVFNIKNKSSVLSKTDLATLDEEGGTIIVASRGPLFPDTILGFSVAHGNRGDTQTSKVTGVVEESRDEGIGLYLKLFQACVAVKYGYTALRWRMDATKGRNANRFFGLGAKVEEFVVNFYGDSPFQPGTGPSDRLSLVWDLNSTDVHNLIQETIDNPRDKDENGYPSQSFRNVMHLPRIQAQPPLKNQANYNGLALTDIHGKPLPQAIMTDNGLDAMLYEIPQTTDKLSLRKQRDAREKLRSVFSKTIRTRHYQAAQVKIVNPGDIDEVHTDNGYKIAKFISCFDDDGQRRNFYLLAKNP